MMEHNLLIFLITESLSVAISMAHMNADLSIFYTPKPIETVFRIDCLNLAESFISNDHNTFRKDIFQIPVKTFALQFVA